MNIIISKDAQQLGQNAAKHISKILNDTINEKNHARMIVSTGASQFEMFKALIKEDVDWSKVEMFHLDEYINLSQSHPASFRKYLKERFISKVNLKAYYLVDGNNNIKEHIAELTQELRSDVIDLGLIGIGENGHIAFNDPPADFDTKEAYIVVDLDEECKNQQVGEGWFTNIDEVPNQAISMSVFQIMECVNIVSCVPNQVKAMAIKSTLEKPLSNLIPATMLKTHNDITLFLDENSASLIDGDKY